MLPLRATAVLLSLTVALFPSLNSFGAFEDGAMTNKVPILVRQGPLITRQQASTQYSWYQVGAIGDSTSYNYVAASITIKTVYDKANNDAHSYWIGGHLPNGAFIQVGYLTSVSTRGLPYCCAWFYEYFPAGQNDCCDPVIGPEGSAGPIGSSHNYSMVHTGNGVWSFYSDGVLLGVTPNLGAVNSGGNAPAGIAEVAQASSNGDILGPGEFSNMQFRTLTGGWQSLQAADSLITYGEGTQLNTPQNPYGVREVNGVNNNFLAGSEIPQLSPPMSSPGPRLWPVVVPAFSFTAVFKDSAFKDSDAMFLVPDWISMRELSGTRRLFFTALVGSYQNLRIEGGIWVVDKIWWHAVNVAGPVTQFSVPISAPIYIQTSASSLVLRVSGIIIGFPVANANVVTSLPDTTIVSASTNSSGLAVMRLLPPGTYYLRITVPYGFSSVRAQNLPAQEVTLRILGLAEVLTAILVAIALAVFAAVYAVQRDRKRARLIATLSPPSYLLSCPKCRSPAREGSKYCSSCGARLELEPPTSSLVI